MKYFISQPMNGKTDEEIKAKRKEVETAILEQEPGAEILDSFFEGAHHMVQSLCGFSGNLLKFFQTQISHIFAKVGRKQEVASWKTNVL